MCGSIAAILGSVVDNKTVRMMIAKERGFIVLVTGDFLALNDPTPLSVCSSDGTP
jgi:hypothetical protein